MSQFNSIPQPALDAINMIKAEMSRQDEKWGANRHHTPIEWAAIITEEVGEAAEQAVNYHFQSPGKDTGDKIPNKADQYLRLVDYRLELIQTGAVIIQALNSLCRNELATNKCRDEDYFSYDYWHKIQYKLDEYEQYYQGADLTKWIALISSDLGKLSDQAFNVQFDVVEKGEPNITSQLRSLKKYFNMLYEMAYTVVCAISALESEGLLDKAKEEMLA